MLGRLLVSASVVVLAVGATACLGGTDSEQLIRREAVTNAFNAVGEPLRLKLDLAIADPGSPVDFHYSAKVEFETTVGPFEVLVFESEDSATLHVVRLETLYGSHVHVVRKRNVVLVVVSKVGPARRLRLVEILESL